MVLQPQSDVHPHGLGDRGFRRALFTKDKPVIFAYHGYPSVIHRLTYHRANHANFHVSGFIENGTTTTPFDMVVLNELDRFHLVLAAIERTPQLGVAGAHLAGRMRDELAKHHRHVRERGEDLPEVRDWVWPS